jgi:hypothetical protein
MRLHLRALLLGLLVGFPITPVFAQDVDQAWVEQQVKAIRESDTTGWQRIPWAGSLLDARRVSEQEKQPLFLFTLDGNLETGRC